MPFAVKEYVQNQVGQVLKKLRAREWNDWIREDLSRKSSVEKLARKQEVKKHCPGLFTGPQGTALNIDAWKALYILHATVPLDNEPRRPLLLATILWNHDAGFYGATFFNNHLDAEADFSTFVVDGASTSDNNPYAVGEKGKGFTLATQYMWELKDTIEDHGSGKKCRELGVGFRVGHSVGELKWTKTPGSQSRHKPRVLAVYEDNLSVVTELDMMLSDDDELPYSDEDDYFSEDEYPVKRKKNANRLLRTSDGKC